MKNYIIKFLEKLGFLRLDTLLEDENSYSLSLKTRFSNLEMDERKNSSQIFEIVKMMENYEEMTTTCVEINHRLKKLEEYLDIEYVTEEIKPPKHFIGYKKKQK